MEPEVDLLAIEPDTVVIYLKNGSMMITPIKPNKLAGFPQKVDVKWEDGMKMSCWMFDEHFMEEI